MAKFFPYLRGKTYELSAIERALPALTKNGKIMPVVEPVRAKTKRIVNKAGAFGKANLPVALVMNPQVGELVGAPGATAQLLGDMRAAGATVVPVMIVHNQLLPIDVQQFQAHVSAGQSIHLHVDLANVLVAAALQQAAPSVNLFVSGTAGGTHQAAFPNRALLRDGFRAQTKNANYPTQSFFSDLHLTYASSGFVGFGDFAIVGDYYTAGGGPAYAVAIHMTEDHGKQGIVCNHFLSTSNTTTANAPGKFGEAVGALAAYSRQHPGAIDFSAACQELLQHHVSGTWPGLGDLKRLSIQHHLELMAMLV